ncbi:MAG: hypothetical protein M3145_13690 [Pseudomonadota bacterium]|nr:hypothetical protein [Pseudomonadota bacterium]
MPYVMPVAPGILAADTITKLPPEADGAVVVSGSHGGRYPGYLAARAGLRGVILNDAGVGRDEAGIGSLPYLEALGIAAAAVSHLSARIGDTADMLARGRISHANTIARAAGVEAGLSCREAAERLQGAPLVRSDPPPLGEARTEIATGGRRIVLLDSAALVAPEDTGQIVVTGSHGGLVGGDPAMALRVEGFAAVFNDAGIGIDNAGITRLPALDARGIPAFTVSAASARIGEARSSFEEGVISAVNEAARRLGAREGERAAPLLRAWAMGDRL